MSYWLLKQALDWINQKYIFFIEALLQQQMPHSIFGGRGACIVYKGLRSQEDKKCNWFVLSLCGGCSGIFNQTKLTNLNKLTTSGD